MLNVLWLCSWYPSRVSPTNGDLVERHAMATAPFVNLTVLCVEKDPSLPPGAADIQRTEEHGFTVYRVYYSGSGRGGLLEKLFSFRRYKQLQEQLYRRICNEKGQPEIIHVHVAMKAGLLALSLKRKEQLPYIVTEHWTGYYPQGDPNIYESNWLLKKITKKVLTGAFRFLPVSRALGDTVARYFAGIPFTAVPNVVDTAVFNYQNKAALRFRFLHVSYLNYQKNPEGILAAAALLKERGIDFEIQMTGNTGQHLLPLVKEYGLEQHIIFEDAIPYHDVANRMQHAHSFLLFSRFENLPCVILEALCCGLPVISSRVGGIAEVINSANGLLVESGAISDLANAMQKMIEGYKTFNREQISARAIQQFNYDTIGRVHLGIYDELMAVNK